MNPKLTKPFKILYWILAASFLTPLVFSRAFSTSVVPKTVFFALLVELGLPFYLYICLKYFGFQHLRNPVIYLAAAFLMLGFVSAFTGVDLLHSFWGSEERMSGLYLSTNVFLWLAYLTLLFKVASDKIDFFAKFAVGIAVITSILGIFQYFHIGILNPNYGDRATAFLDNPIYFAAYLIIPLFLCLYLGEKDRERRNWYLGFAVLILLGVGSTNTAGAAVGLAGGFSVAALVYFFDRKKLKPAIITLGIIVLLGVAGLLAVLKVPNLSNQFRGADAQSRLVEWGIALRGFREKPVFGVGPENYSYLAQKYNNPKIYKYISNASFDKPHNYFLEILTTTGIAGILTYAVGLWFVLRGFWRLYAFKKISKFGFAALVGGFAAYLIQNVFAFDVIAGSLMLIFLYSISAIGFETGDNRISLKNWAPNLGFILGAAPFLILFGVNMTLAKTDLYVTRASKHSLGDPAVSEKYYEELSQLPFYTDRSRTASEHSNFVTGLPVQIGRKITLDDAKSWTDLAIADNQHVVERKPQSLGNLQALAALYLVKAQLTGYMDQKIYEVAKKADAIAPNRIETDLILSTAYAYVEEPDKAQQVVDKLKEMAPTSEDVVWQQIFVYSLTNQPKQVLDAIKLQLNSGLDAEATTQIDKLTSFYVNIKDFQQAMAICNEAIAAYPDRGYPYICLAKIYVASKDSKTAQEIINNLKQKNPAEYEKYKNQIESFIPSS